MRLRWAFGLIAIACGAPAVPEAPRFAIAAPASIECVHASERTCVVPLPITIDNATSGAVALRSIRASREGLDGAVTWDYDARQVPVGRTRVLPPTGVGAGRWSIELVARDASGAERRASTIVTVHDRAREAAVAACDACHGTWGAYGMLEIEGCDCPTTDAGKICHDVSDCEGDCLDPEAEPIDARTYRLIGRCSPRTKTFGCLARVRPGTYPRTGRAHVFSICVD